jgi:hypothetical protein
MPMFPHQEFSEIDLATGWQPVDGYPDGIWYKELAGDLSVHSARARLVKFAAGAFTTAPVVHETAETVLVLSGDLVVGSDAEGRGGTVFRAPCFAIRPAGIVHGPFASREGCVMLELMTRG